MKGQVTLQLRGVAATIPCERFEEVPGLVIHRMVPLKDFGADRVTLTLHDLRGQPWCVTHEGSSLRLGDTLQARAHAVQAVEWLRDSGACFTAPASIIKAAPSVQAAVNRARRELARGRR